MKHAIANTGDATAKHRHKFFCSHGGKILPRPADGQLKYVGGETRCISAPRGMPFQEVMKRLTYQINGEMVLKYQLVTEDLDALVSVKSEEDVVHMFDEMEHYESAGCPRMRAFLFPINQAPIMENLVPVEQRYSINTNQLSSSASSSPRSPDTINTESVPHNNYQNGIITCSPHQNHLQPNSGRNAAADKRLVSVRSVTAPFSDHPFYGSREINQSCAKCIMHHGDHRGRFYDTRIIERQATLPAHF